MDQEDRAAGFGVLGGEIYFIIKWQYQKAGVYLDSGELLRLCSLFGATGCLGGMLGARISPVSVPLPVSAMVGGILFSFFLLTCAQLLGEEKPTKFAKNYPTPFFQQWTCNSSGTAPLRQTHSRDVNEVPNY